MRSIWKGHIRFSLVTIPVQLYSAVDADSQINFRQLHAKDNGRIQYKKICSTCNEEVPQANIVKGYEYIDDSYIVISNEELDSLKIASTKAVDIEAFVDLKDVHPTMFESSYYLGPNGDVAIPTFNLFVKTLQQSGKAGVARVTLRDKEDVALIAAYEGGLIMYKLRYPDEVRPIKNVPGLKESEADKSQVDLALTLVSSLEKKFSEIAFVDRYKEKLNVLVDQKVKGNNILTMQETKEDKPVVDIMDALKKSIEEAQKLKKGA
jgi:DNA end-binding protein Ku